MKWIEKLLRDDQATTAVEYAVLLALILVTMIAAITSVGAGTGGLWGSTESALSAAGFGS